MPKAKTREEKQYCEAYGIKPNKKKAMQKLRKLRPDLFQNDKTIQAQCKGGCGTRIRIWFRLQYCDHCLAEMAEAAKRTQQSYKPTVQPYILEREAKLVRHGVMFDGFIR